MALLFDRFRARYRLGRRVRLWYHPDYAAEQVRATGRVPSIQPLRAELALEELADQGLLRPTDIQLPHLASFAELERVHPEAYIDASTEPDVLARIFAMPSEEVQVDPLLRAQRRQVGGTIAATRFACTAPAHIGVNLGGGFHHAEPEQGAGFCVYNDVAIAIATARSEGFDGRVIIVDVDYHHGNGNMVVFASDPSVLTLSVHGAPWSHAQARANIDLHLPDGVGDDDYVETVSSAVTRALAEHRPTLAFYLAGTDVLAGDPLGGFSLTPEGVLRRDRRLLTLLLDAGASTVVTMAGGYTDDAWRLTAALIRWLLTGQTKLSRDSDEPLRIRFSRIAQTLDPFELQREVDDGLALTDADIMQELEGPSRSRRLLDYYSAHGIELALERYGLLRAVRRLGFTETRVTIDLDQPQRQTVRLHGRRGRDVPVMLVELVVRRQRIRLPEAAALPPLEMLVIEWLLLQNPTQPFSPGHPPLPGQQHPGLGVSRPLLEMLYQACRRLQLEALLVRPAHYHTARMGRQDSTFTDPELQGRLDVLVEYLDPHPLPVASRWLDEGAVTTRDGETVTWVPGDYIVAIGPSARDWVTSRAYAERRMRAAAQLREAGLVLPQA